MASFKDRIHDIRSKEGKLKNAACVALVKLCELGDQLTASKLSTDYPFWPTMNACDGFDQGQHWSGWHLRARFQLEQLTSLPSRNV